MADKYYIRLEAVTPLSVGAGNDAEWVKCADYVISSGKVYLLDLHRIAKLGVNLLDQISNMFVSQDHDGIIRLLGNRLPEVSHRIFTSPCTTDNNIKAFERSQMHDLPVIAGSSLKGAIRSALFKHLLTDETPNKDINEKVFGKMKDGSDYMRFIQVGDFEMPETALFNSKIFNLHLVDGEWCGGWKHALQNGTNGSYRSTGFNTLYECISPGINGVGTLVFSPEQFDRVVQKGTQMSHTQEKSAMLNGGIRALFAIVNDYTREYLYKEKAFFEQYQADRSEQIIACIDQLLASIPSDNSSCLLKMSAGVGFHAITGDWQYEDYAETGVHESGRNSGKQKYKSRKVVETTDGLKLMGFVRLAQIAAGEYHKAVNEIQESFKARIESDIEQREAAKAERIAAEQEKKAKKDNYDRLIAEAQAAENRGDYMTAKAKAEEAAELFPSEQSAKGIITRVKVLAAQQEAEKKLKDATNIAEAPFDKDIAQVKDFTQMKGRCKKRKADFCTEEGKVIVEQWLEEYFKSLTTRERKNFQKPKKWIETFGDCYDEATIKDWILKYT